MAHGWKGGVADILIQNELGPQAVALGDHERRLGTSQLASLISGVDGDGVSIPDFDGTDENLSPRAARGRLTTW